jgi:roadblock/LC7 domain-containing protein
MEHIKTFESFLNETIINESEGKIAVIYDLGIDDQQWYVANMMTAASAIMIKFYKKYPVNTINDTLWAPRKLYMGITNGKYDVNHKLSKKYGVLPTKNTGSFSEMFDAAKEKEITKLLEKEGFTIIRKGVYNQ